MKATKFVGVGLLLAACGSCRKQQPSSPAPAQAPAPSPVAEAKRVREPTVAGQFYPGEPEALRVEVRRMLAGMKKTASAPVRMVLVPHAGYVFSGAVAAASFKQLDPGFTRAVIVAGNHNGAARYSGVSVDTATHYRVPGAEVKVAAAARELISRPGFVEVPAAHTMHMAEVELPFLLEVAGGPFELVPLVVGHLTRDQTRAVAAELAKLAEPKTVFAFSVDLSHYYTYQHAVALDRSCLAALEHMDADAVSACDTDATQVLLVMTELAALLASTPQFIVYANSGDASGDRSRVVGYGAIAYEDRFHLTPAEGDALTELGRRAVEARVRDGRSPEVSAEIVRRWPRLATPRAAFVTLKKAGRLRGCIGSLTPEEPLAADVAANAVRAAVADSRFPPVRPNELSAIDLTVSVLEAPRPMEGVAGDAIPKKLGETKPGLVLTLQGRRSTFLPEVWEELPDPLQFLEHLCAKQGSPPTCWRDPSARFEVYGSQHFAEKGR